MPTAQCPDRGARRPLRVTQTAACDPTRTASGRQLSILSQNRCQTSMDLQKTPSRQVCRTTTCTTSHAVPDLHGPPTPSLLRYACGAICPTCISLNSSCVMQTFLHSPSKHFSVSSRNPTQLVHCRHTNDTPCKRDLKNQRHPLLRTRHTRPANM